MRLRKIAIGTVAAGSVAAAGLGVGAGLASAAPAPHSGGGTQQVHQQQAPTPRPQSHAPVVRPNAHPFNYQGQPVVPYRDQHRGWGFWLFGNWIPLAFGS